MKVKCPNCGKETEYEGNPFRPFCSKECKLADLYRWMSEEVGIELPEESEEDDAGT